MTDTDRPGEQPAMEPQVDEPLRSLLRSSTTWAEPGPDVEDAVVAAITAEAAGSPAQPTRIDHEADTPSARSRRRATVTGALAGVAACVVLLLIAVTVDVVRVDPPGGPEVPVVDVVLDGSAGFPDAGADVALQDLPDGLRIDLRVRGLPPAPAGEWYEMVVRPVGGPAVSAGSFHLRGGGARVVLWAGVDLGRDLAVDVLRQPDGTAVLTGVVDEA